MSRFRCFDTYNLQNTSSSDYTTDVRRKTIFTEYQTIAIGNVNFQKGLIEGVIPPGYLRKDNGAYYYGPVYVTTDDIAVNNCLIGAKNYSLLYDVLFAAQPSPDDIKNTPVSFNGANWQGNILKTTYKSVPNAIIGPAISNIPDGSNNKIHYASRQDFIQKYDEINPPEKFPGMIIDPSYNVFYPRCSVDQANNYSKNLSFNFTTAQLENTELVNYLRLSSARNYKAFPYPLNFQNTTCQKYPFSFIFSFINQSQENAEQISLKYMPLVNVDNTILYEIEYDINGSSITYFINFKYTGAPSDQDGLTFNIDSSNTLVTFYNNNTSNLTIENFNLIPLCPSGNQFRGLHFSIAGNDIPIIKPFTSLDNAFKDTIITLNGNGISNWRTAGVLSMNSTFMNSNFNGDLNWDTSYVNDMRSIFENATLFNKPIGTWDISQITNMSRMFYGATSFNQPLNDWNTSNVTLMRNLFSYASSFDQSLNNWNVGNVVDMSGLFMYALNFNGNIRTWNTENVLSMDSLLKNVEAFNGDISYDPSNNYWNTYKTKTFRSIFENTVLFNDDQTPLPSINAGTTNPLNWINFYSFLPDINDPATLNITTNSTLRANGLTRENAFPFNKFYIFSYSFYDNSLSSVIDICNNLPILINGTSSVSNLTVTPATIALAQYRNVSFTFLYNSSDSNSGLNFYNVKNFYNGTGDSSNNFYILNFDYIPLSIDNGFGTGSHFEGLYNLDISNQSFAPTIVNNTKLSNTFYDASGFNSSNLANWNVSRAITMTGMFQNINFNQDISNWNTSNVTDMSGMFYNNANFNQDISKWNTSKVTNMSNMFQNASGFNSKLEYDQSNNYWDVSSVLNMTSMFQNATSFNDGQSPGGITQPLNWILNPNVNLTNVRTGASVLTNQNAYPLPSFYTLIYNFWNQSSTAADISNNIPFIFFSPSTVISTTVTPNTNTQNEYKTVSVTTSYQNHIQDLSSGISFIDVYGFFNANNTSLNPLNIIQFGGTPLARNNRSTDGYQFAELNNCNITRGTQFYPPVGLTGASGAGATITGQAYGNGLYTPSASSTTGSNFPWYAFDKSVTAWRCNNNYNSTTGLYNNTFSTTTATQGNVFGEWLQIILPNPIILDKFFISSRDSPASISPKTIKIVGSNTGANPWNIIYESTNLALPSSGSIYYLSYVPPAYQYYRLIILATNGNGLTNYTEVRELTLFDYNSLSDFPSILPNTTLSYCFYNSKSKLNVSSWDTSNVISMASMFQDSSMNSALPWNTSKVVNMSNMFKNNIYFNNNLSYTGGQVWDVSGVLNMTSIFEGATIFNNGYGIGDITHPLNWILNPNVNTTNCIENTPLLTVENAYPLAKLLDRFIYTFYNTTNISAVDISNLYLPIKTTYTNLNYYYPPLITTNPLDNSFTTVTVYYRYNEISPVSTDGLTFIDVSNVYNLNNNAKTITRFGRMPISINDGINNGSQFSGINNLVFNTSDVPTIRSNTTFQNIFNNSLFNSDVSGWDTANVISMNSAFADTSFNKILNTWNTSNVTDMSGMFYNNTLFNQPINNWNVSNVEKMTNMFYKCQSFNQDISGWITNKLDDMSSMFYECINFNQYLSTWDVSSVTNFSNAFYECFNFNNGDAPSLSNNPLYWDTKSATNMEGLFNNSSSFNQDISGWNTGNVTNMSYLFYNADVFNRPIDAWDVSNVQNMSYMFYGNNFNQDISGWNTSSLTNMESMFHNNTAFNNQISYIPTNSLTSWYTGNVTNFTSVLQGAINFNNGEGFGGIDQSLNWILPFGCITTRAVFNTTILSVQNAEPFTKIIFGNFKYSFHNNSDKTNEDISNNYIPIIDICGNFTYLSPVFIDNPSPTLDPSFTIVDVSFSFVPIAGTIDGLSFYDSLDSVVNFYNSTGDRIKILQFDNIPISSSNGYQFANLSYLDISVNNSDEPYIQYNTTFDHAFYNTPTFNSGNIEYWDSIFINNMSSMFEDSSFNKPLRFNTKTVTDMKNMFKNADNFNQNLSYNNLIDTNIWNVSNVNDMTGMFYNAGSFNNGQIINNTTNPLNWTLKTTVDISNVRRNTPLLTNQNAYPLPSLYVLNYNFNDTTGVSGEEIIQNYSPITLNGKSSLYNCSVDPSNITTGTKTVSLQLAYDVIDGSNTGLSFYSSGNTISNFYNSNVVITQFDNIPLSKNNDNGQGYQFANMQFLDFSANDNVSILPNTTLSYCFINSSNFNSDISGWNTSNVTNMSNMFDGASTFNKPLQPWNTSKVTNMENMFIYATSFNQTIKYVPALNYWDVSGVTNMRQLFYFADSFNNGFPKLNTDNSLNWVLNPGVDTTDAVTNSLSLTNYNGLPLTTIYPNEFIYKFYNLNGASDETIVNDYLPFIKTGNLTFGNLNDVKLTTIGPSGETIVSVRFLFTDNGTTPDGLNFNATSSIVNFYNQTQLPVEILKFGGMPISRYYKNSQQSFWSAVQGTTFNSFGYAIANESEYNNNNYVAVGGTLTNTILKSSDGKNWTSVTGPTFGGIGYAVIFGLSGKVVAVGDDNGGSNTILYSNDYGNNWSSVTGTTFNYAGYGVTFANNKWIAVGDNGFSPTPGSSTILLSNNGSSWSNPSGSTGFTIAGFGIAYGYFNDRWVAVGAGTNAILYSNDNGNNWTAATGTTFTSYGQNVLYVAPNRWVAIGEGTDTILYSTDGVFWTATSGAKIQGYTQSISYSSSLGRFVAVGYDNGGSTTIIYSNDGQNWNNVSGITFNFAGYGVTYSNISSRFIAVGDNNGSLSTILVSQDGINWFAAKGTRFNVAGYGVASGIYGAVAVGTDTGVNTILYSEF